MKHFRLKFYIQASMFLIVSLSFVLSPLTLFAQTAGGARPVSGINMTVSPAYISLVADPGKSLSSSFKVKNNSNARESLKVGLMKYSMQDEKRALVNIQPDDEFVSWLSFSQKSFLVEPNETKTVKFTFSPPANASLGYYYAIVISRQQEGQVEQGAVVAGAPAIPLLVEVRSALAKRELQLTSFTSDKLIYEYLPVRFHVKVKNTGNIHIVPFGDVFIDSGSKKNINILQANAAKGTVLPQTERVLDVSWEDGFAVVVAKTTPEGKEMRDSKGKVVYETQWNFSKADRFRIGKYTAHLLMVYDNGTRDIPLEASVSFWVIPWKLLGILSVIVLFALLGVRATFLPYLQKIKRKK